MAEIIKYNKRIQNKLNININYSKNYLKIEIEVFPITYNKKKIISLIYQMEMINLIFIYILIMM